MTRNSKGAPRSFSKRGPSERGDKKSFSKSEKPTRTFKSDKPSFRKSEGDSSERKSYSSDKPAFKKREGGYSEKKSYSSDKPSFRKSEGDSSERRSYSSDKPAFKKREGGYSEKKSYNSDKPSFRKNEGDSSERRSYSSDKPAFKKREGGYSEDREKKPFKKLADGKYESASKREYSDKGEKSYPSKSYTKRDEAGSDKPARKAYGDRESSSYTRKPKSDYSDSGYKRESKPFDRKSGSDSYDKKPYEPKLSKEQRIVEKSKKIGPKKTSTQKDVQEGAVRLNRYIANAGVCSRREADVLIATGVVTVNGKIVTEMGYKVNPTDVVNYGGVPIKNETKRYLVLNKPKDYITTMDDPQERRTVMELIRNACKERLYPVGRLDRNTTGLLLFTNDGDIAAKLTHPKFEIRKVYHVTLDKRMTSEDYRMLSEGIELSDGFIKPDAVEYVGAGKNELGIEIHSGKNRIVRRMMEHLGYEVVRLDRVAFAGLTKKDLPRSKFRFLTEKEISFLKMLG
jgi:23S rRNA pseudouridine2605 synthase